jgi:serine/threonine protein kinase
VVDPLAPEQLGQYRLLDRIAVGGMAEVFSATQPQQGAGADRTVVVKRMLPRIASDPSARAMFAEEARLGRHVRHTNVVQVIDYGESEQNPYLVLEYVKGVDLWRLMRFLTRTGQTLSVSEAVFVAREMLIGLHAVHEATDEQGTRLGVVHRDVSPSNVLLSVHGDVKLGDLGIARSRLREKFPGTSMHDRAKGKLGYLAPEQVKGTEPDRRADVFSAGVVTAELLMGRPLFSGGSELAVLLAIRDSKIHPFLEFATQLPAGLAEIVVDALAQKAPRRHGTAEIFASLLHPYLTEPVASVQARLAKLVIEALDVGPSQLPVQVTPTRTMTDPKAVFAGYANNFDDATPLHDPMLPPLLEPPASGSLKLDSVYRVTTTSNSELGPWTFAEIVQAISTGRLSPLDQICVDGSPPRVLCELHDLARHLPSSTSASSLEGDAHDLRLSGEIMPLNDGGVVLALARAALERSTALLLCELSGVRKEIYIKDGAPAFVTSNQASELLGEYLVAHDVITRAELDMALAVMPRFEGRLGDTLSALGLVEPVVLFQHIAGQVRDKLIDLFLWTSGSCTHYHGVAPPPSGFPLNIDAWDVLDQGLAARVARGLEESRMQLLRTRRILPATGPHLSAIRTALPQRMRRLLTELDRPRSVPDLIVRLAQEQEPEQVVRDALLLLHLGALRLGE